MTKTDTKIILCLHSKGIEAKGSFKISHGHTLFEIKSFVQLVLSFFAQRSIHFLNVGDST